MARKVWWVAVGMEIVRIGCNMSIFGMENRQKTHALLIYLTAKTQTENKNQ